MPVLPTNIDVPAAEGPGFSTFSRALNPNPRTGAFDSSHLAGSLSQGLTALASGTGQLARVATAEANRFRDEAIANTLAQSQDLAIIDGVREKAREDGSGYADQVREALVAHDAELLGRLPGDQDTLRRFREVRADRVGTLYQRALVDELEMRTAYGVARAEDSIRALTNAVLADPRESARAIREGKEVIAAIPGRTPLERRLMAEAYERNIHLTSYSSMLDGAQSAAQVAEVERYLRTQGKKDLDPQDYARLLSGARAQRRSMATKARRSAKAEVSSYREALQSGAIPTVEETEAMVRAAQAAGDPDLIEAAARAASFREASVGRADMPLDVQLTEVEDLRLRMTSGELDEAGRAELAAKEAVLTTSVKLADHDTVTFLRRAGVEIPDIIGVGEDGETVVDAGALAARTRLMLKEGERMGLLPGEIKPLTASEHRRVLAAIAEDPSLTVGIADAMQGMSAPEKAAMVGQLGAGDAIASAPVRAIRAGASPQTVDNIAAGTEILRSDKESRKRFKLAGDERDSFSAAAALVPTIEGEDAAAWKAAADAAYAQEAQAQGYTEFNPDRYRTLALRARGLREIEVHGVATAVPETSPLTGETIEAAFELAASSLHKARGDDVAASPDRLLDWAVDGITSGPKTPSGRDVSIEEIIDDGQVVHMGGDVYAVRMGDGRFLTAEGPAGPNGTPPRYMFRMPDDFLQREQTVAADAGRRYKDFALYAAMENLYQPSGDGYVRQSDYVYITEEEYREELLDRRADVFGRFRLGYEDFDPETGEDVQFYQDRTTPGEFIRADEVIRRRDVARLRAIGATASHVDSVKAGAVVRADRDWLAREVER